MQRLAVIPPTLAGLAAGWLCSALLFAVWRRPSPILSLVVLYAITAWDLRWWTELRTRMPLAIFGGGILVAAFRPIVGGRSLFDGWSDLLQATGPFSVVNWALSGATLFLIVVFVIWPMTDARKQEPSDHTVVR